MKVGVSSKGLTVIDRISDALHDADQVVVCAAVVVLLRVSLFVFSDVDLCNHCFHAGIF